MLIPEGGGEADFGFGFVERGVEDGDGSVGVFDDGVAGAGVVAGEGLGEGGGAVKRTRRTAMRGWAAIMMTP